MVFILLGSGNLIEVSQQHHTLVLMIFVVLVMMMMMNIAFSATPKKENTPSISDISSMSFEREAKTISYTVLI